MLRYVNEVAAEYAISNNSSIYLWRHQSSIEENEENVVEHRFGVCVVVGERSGG